jgi:hypothetical protein
MMRISHQCLLLVALAVGLPASCRGGNDDTFTYKNTDEGDRKFGPEDWDRVECPDKDTCVRTVNEWMS